MDPEFGVGIGHGGSRGKGRPRPSLAVRALELAGLGLVIYGLGRFQLGPILLGTALILGSYAAYRRKHGAGPGDSAEGFDGPEGDGGAD